ncbi:MAG TPA: hypothetical protein HPP77_07500 [Candidatus Hydrogenedentes bacterium]|nr:hypothetical protein [Candidatus Hydrogenedentota bacterium]HIJ74368.1 hypothetical protein [Candidatus Hydrogenedentota bacterium]
MPIATCPRCKRVFDKGSIPVCPKCESDEQSDYERIREVLERLPHLNAEEIALEADIDRDTVLRMLEQGLIQNVSINQQIKCGRCGAPAISISKRLCQACLEKMNAEAALAQSKVKLPPKKSAQVGETMMNVRKTIQSKRKAP